jgi:hypothetical protein
MARVTTALFLLALAVSASAQDEFRDGRIRYQEPGVLMQRAGESEAEDAFVNAPFLPGDRLWTDGSGRAELQFEGTTFLRLDSRGKLDFVSRDQGRRNDLVVLRLWSGGIYVHVGDGRYSPDFELETPGGVVEFLDRGVYRVDVESGETRLSVYDGEAALDSGGRRMRVDAGERTYARRDEEPERPQPFDRDGDYDDFARWDQEREDRVAWAGESERYLPEDVDYYGGELDESGSWYYEAEVGHVWRPYVATGWQPYSNGHWVWTSWGWTWVPYDPWGWVTFHYGRWGHSPAIGWYWIPGSVWGPAWVSWAVGGNYVGWCPLGYRDRPVFGHDFGRTKGFAVPRGSEARSGTTIASTAANPVAGFTFVNKADMGKRAQRRFAASADVARNVQVVDSQRASLNRELKVADARPAAQAPRTVKTKPTFGDTVPELRSDPTTTIPIFRRGDRKSDDDPDPRYRVDTRSEGHPTDRRSPRTVQPNRAEEPRWQTRPDAGSRPTDLRSPRSTESSRAPDARASERDADTRRSRPLESAEPERRPTPWTAPLRSSPPTERGTARDSDVRERETAPPRREPERDVLRRFFQPANEGRSRSEGGSERTPTPRTVTPRAEPRAPAPTRVEPRRANPPPSTPRQPAQSERARPKKDKP